MGGRSRAQRGSDEAIEMRISFEDAVFGTSKEIEVNRLVGCDTCNGSGDKPGTQSRRCSQCDGQGFTISIMRTPVGVFQQQAVRSSAHLLLFD